MGLSYGVDHAIDVTGAEAVNAVNDMTGGIGADLVVEAVGSTETYLRHFISFVMKVASCYLGFRNPKILCRSIILRCSRVAQMPLPFGLTR
ncbi:MAG: hypothetical protein CM1200mP39_27420 [Dehalococcoidia bacterium]|nr:MAG: hypothetical protein CM1200mP39_27420 [Dehalococcoidia bacterium]